MVLKSSSSFLGHVKFFYILSQMNRPCVLGGDIFVEMPVIVNPIDSHSNTKIISIGDFTLRTYYRVVF